MKSGDGIVCTERWHEFLNCSMKMYKYSSCKKILVESIATRMQWKGRKRRGININPHHSQLGANAGEETGAPYGEWDRDGDPCGEKDGPLKNLPPGEGAGLKYDSPSRLKHPS